MTRDEWQKTLDERFPAGANLSPAGSGGNSIIPRFLVLGVGLRDGVEVAEILAIPVDVPRDFYLYITGIQESAQGTLLKGVNQSWFVGGNVPTTGEQGERLQTLRERAFALTYEEMLQL